MDGWVRAVGRRRSGDFGVVGFMNGGMDVAGRGVEYLELSKLK